MKEVSNSKITYCLRKLNNRLSRLEQGQKRLDLLHKQIAKINIEMQAAWMDIKKLDNRIAMQQKKLAR